jgi:hypothetical protein
MAELPTGTVTFLFTDMEGSTKLLQRVGGERYGEIRADHERLRRRAISRLLTRFAESCTDVAEQCIACKFDVASPLARMRREG